MSHSPAAPRWVKKITPAAAAINSWQRICWLMGLPEWY